MTLREWRVKATARWYKTLLALAALGTFASALVVEAQAVPAPRIAAQDDASMATVVSGCGFRRHWSPRFRRCVWDGRGF
jgi:hypothetical protein